MLAKKYEGSFYWKCMTKSVKQFVFLKHLNMKIENAAKPGLLQPLPKEVWVDISMDFITDLPKSMEKEVIFVVVDSFSKAAQFMALSHPFTAIQYRWLSLTR